MYVARVSLSMVLTPLATTYEWSQSVQGLLNSAFYLGYLVTQPVGGYLSRRFGGKHVLSTSLFLSSLCCALCPQAFQTFWLFLALRIGMGLAQGLAYPSMVEMLTKWVVPSEQAFAFNFAWSGGQVGTIVAFMLPGFLALEVPFYIYGVLGMLWIVAWSVLVYECPRVHPSLSPEERAFLESCQVRLALVSEDAPCRPSLASVLCSRPVFVYYLTYFSFNWTFYMLLSNLPKFMQTMLLLSPKSTSLLLFIPYVAFLCISIAAAVLADLIFAKGYSVALFRKYYVAVGFILPAIALLTIPLVDPGSQSSLMLVEVFLATSLPAIAKAGFAPAVMDISPMFASCITSICFVVVAVAGILAPLFVGFVLEHGNCNDRSFYGSPIEFYNCLHAWHLIFYTSAALFVIGAISWVLFSGNLKSANVR